jgi:hypothetical protein
MGERRPSEARAAQAKMDSYVRSVAGTADTHALGMRRDDRLRRIGPLPAMEVLDEAQSACSSQLMRAVQNLGTTPGGQVYGAD